MLFVDYGVNKVCCCSKDREVCHLSPIELSRTDQMKRVAVSLRYACEKDTIFYERYVKGLPFLSKMVYKRVSLWTLGRASLYV